MSSTSLQRIRFDKEQNEQLGADVDNNLVVTQVKPGTLADGKLHLGDKISAVNDVRITSYSHLCDIWQRSQHQCIVSVIPGRSRQDQQQAAEPQSTPSLASQTDQIPADRERWVTRRPGYNYMLITLQWTEGSKFGLGIKHHQNRVFVCRLEPDSIASSSPLKWGDRIIDVSGRPVSNKDVTRDYILANLQQPPHTTSFVVERAQTDDAKRLVKESVEHKTSRDPPSINMPSDVQDIMKREVKRMESNPTQPVKSCLKTNGTGVPDQQRVTISSLPPQEHRIRDDTDPSKKLRSVPRQ